MLLKTPKQLATLLILPATVFAVLLDSPAPPTDPAPATPPPAPATPSTGTFRDKLQDGSLGPKMVVIPGGTFKIGDIQGGGDDDEEPVHEVIVGSFAMGKYEITFAEYDRFVEATKYDRFAKATSRSKPDDEGWGRGNRPVINVSWDDVTAYAEWLTQQTGHQYSLPAEAQWEYAARAGTQTKHWWGNKASHEYANYGADSCCSGLAEGKDQWVNTSPVGSFAANPFGLHDTAGNVWEWTCSEYDDSYKGHEYQCFSKEDANDDNNLVLRGGSWVNGAWMIRSAYRERNQRSYRSKGVGVRLARNL
jgi:formylglycine-generating enzyme required for sulfatase activity